MMHSRILFFGDQATDPCPCIRQLKVLSTKSPRLRDFFAAVDHLLRSNNTSTDEHANFEGFESVVSLAEKQASRQGNEVVTSTLLLCVAQLGNLILQVDNNPGILWASRSNLYIVGFCTGLLPAALAATVPSPADLLSLAMDVILVALQLAVEVSRRSRQIEDSTKSWAIVVKDIHANDLQGMIDSFNENQRLPLYKQAYISAEFETSVTVSGPPSTLSLLVDQESFRRFPKTELPIAAAYHAGHLDMPSADKLLRGSTIPDLPIRKNATILSSSSGSPYNASSLHKLLPPILEDTLKNKVSWSNAINGLVSDLRLSCIALTIIDPVVTANLLHQSLTSAGVNITEWNKEARPRYDDSRLDEGSNSIAIVGMSCRLPGADNVEQLWNILQTGQDMHKTVPIDRFNIKSHVDISGTTKNTSKSAYGCFLDEPGLFDATLFNISPREAKAIDPIHRLLLMTTYEALEMAGYADDDKRRIGTFFGQATDDWRETNASQNIDLYYIPGGMRAFGPGRLNYYFKWEGPSYSIDAACSSSLAALEMAYNALLRDECDMAVVGGGNLLSGPQMFSGLSRGEFLSPTGACKVLDAEADGYCRGEGVGVVVLKRLRDAVNERDNISAVIRAVATNHSAHAMSITHPHAPTQQKLYERVLQKSLVNPADVNYIEMHGTGTQAGDTTEAKSVCSVFGSRRRADNPLRIGAAKANFGHGEAAAGITSILKSVLMLENGVIPPHPGLKSRLNPDLPPLADMHIEVPSESRAFKAARCGDARRRILINNFNATGGNTCLLMEDYDLQQNKDLPDSRSSHVVAISARSLKSLHENKKRILWYLCTHRESRLADISYTTTARRMHHVYRSGYSVESTEELRAAIEMDLASGKEPDRTPDGLTCIFVFSGQGSQYTGMGKELFTTCSVFRECILDCNAICINLGFGPFLNLILHEEIKLGDFTSAQTQLALVSLEIALLNTWKSWGIEPDIVMGHSLGEYVALCAAGVLSVYDVLYLIGSRGQLMQSNCAPYTHSMLAIESSCNIVEKVLESEEFSDCTISCINSQCSTVVSGSLEKLKALRSKFEGTRTSMLNLPYAFHSAQVDPVLDEFRLVSAGVRFNKPRIPVISTLLGLAVEKEGVFGADYLARQTREPVDFLRGVKACKQKAMGPRSVWLEVGPAPVCLGLMRSTVATSVDHMIPTLKPNTNSWTTVSKAVSQLYTTGANIQWASYHKDCIQSLHLLRMPTYAFDTKKYWIPYEGDWALMTRDYPKTNGLLSNFSTTCLQRIDEEVHEQHSSSITFSSDMAEPGLFGMIQGHLVHGFGLCPSSVYTDMAMTAASYLFQKMEDTKEVPAMNVANMEIFNPLVVLPSSLNSIFKLQAKRRKDSTSVDIQCSSEHNTISQQHAHCTVEFESHQIWKRKWDQTEHLVNARSDTLIGAAKSGQAHNILQAMVYKLFANLVLYSERYRSIQEVFMHDTLNEGAAILKFHPLERGEEFTLSPYWVDAIIHLGGFVLNGHAKVPEDTAYICTGWDSLCVPTDLSCEEHYTSYVHMRSTGHGMFLGNIFLLKDGETLAMCGGLRFQQIRKASLQTLLSTVSGKLGDNPLAIRGVNPTHCDTTFSSQEYQSLSRAPLPRNSTCTSSAARLLEVRRIIAEEADMECSELPGHVGFEELGIDSILKMHISSKIQEHTKLIIPPSVFNTCPTISAFLEYIEKTKEFTTPGITLDRPETARTCSSSSDITAVDSAGDPNVFDTLLSIISAESGIEKSELTSSSKFVDLGVDSLISIAVVSRLKDQTGKMLPSSFFKDHPTVSMAKQALYPSTTCQFTGTCASSQDKSSKPPRFSRTVFLQGDPESEDPCLFLVADGSGSPAAYHHLPPLPSGIPVYGLESPFCHEPMEWDCSFADVAVMYKEAIRRIQPHGPYTIGGWSLGGMQAFEITRQLLLEGERVQRLLLIDAPSPKSLLHVPEPTMEVLENIGLFNALRKAGMQGDTFLRTQQHLMQSIRALNKYDPEAISSDRRPENVSVIWGASGIFEQLGDRVTQATELACREGGPLNPEETNELQRWMTTPREDFGPNGWERLVGEDIQCYRTDGDHFSMMNPPLVHQTGQLIAKILEDFIAPVQSV